MKPIRTSEASGARLPEASGVRVLAVDDEPAACRLLAAIFAAPAFQCTTAEGGQEGLAAIQAGSFDVIISDLRMPGTDGMALLVEARRRHPHVAFLVATGVDDVETGIQAIRSGADDYLVKPMTESAVLAGVERALHKRRLEQEVENYRRHLEEIVAERTSQLHEALEQVKHTYGATLKALGTAIDLRDGETEGHSQRVCSYSLEIGRRIGLSRADLENIARGAYLHDIGKLGIPDRILLKPGPLDLEEWTIMQGHVRLGFELVKDIPFLSEAAEIILTHHERFDGGGYPRALQGEGIPLGGRIFGVADAFDAITSNRPYRRALPFSSGRDVIRRESGRQFDPEIASIFLTISEDDLRLLKPTISSGMPLISKRSA